MGLFMSHDAFSGSASAFNGLRQKVAKAIGGSYPPHDDKEACPDEDRWYWDTSVYSHETHPGLAMFLCHPDDEGEISWLEALSVAKDLEALLPEIAKHEDGTHNHIQGVGGYAAATEKFIAGCRTAFELKEPLTFG